MQVSQDLVVLVGSQVHNQISSSLKGVDGMEAEEGIMPAQLTASIKVLIVLLLNASASW